MIQWALVPCKWGAIILEETTLIRIEMFYHKVKVISQDDSELISSDSSLEVDK